MRMHVSTVDDFGVLGERPIPVHSPGMSGGGQLDGCPWRYCRFNRGRRRWIP